MKQDITHLLSKYGRILCFGMLTAFAVAACQKDDRTVVLNAVISEQTNSNAKVYVEGNTAYWQHGDKVKVNGTECDVSVTAPSTTTARIINVGAADKYTAGYPSEYTTHVNDGSLKIEIPHDHVYEVANRYDGSGATAQRIVSPMAAYTEDGTTLMFQNVASLLEVEIENESIDHEMTLYAVEVVSDNAPLSGILPVGFDEEGAVTVNPSDATATQKSVIMHFTGVGSSVVLDKSSGSGTKTAKVYIPILPILESKKSNLTVHVMATGDDNMKYTFHKTSVTSGGVWIARNAMGSISCKLNSSTCAGENANFWGKGTPECPYIIENEADLIRLRDTVNRSQVSGNGYNTSGVCYRQTQNITLNETKWGTPANKAIGQDSIVNTRFSAKYDGEGHWVELKITGIESSDITATSYIGLFGVVGGGGKIENLTMKGEINAVEDNIAYNIYVGSLVAYVNGNFTIEKCKNEISFSFYKMASSKTLYCGGVCGFINSGTVSFSEVTNTGNLIGSESVGVYYLGGICGGSNDSGPTLTISNCVNSGKVNVEVSSYPTIYIGGIMGYIGAAATIESCTNEEIKENGIVVNTVSGKLYVGGIAGYVKNAGSSFTSCTNKGKVYGTSNGVGGIIGYVANSVTISGTTINSGPITGQLHVGGIVGFANKIILNQESGTAINDETATITGTGTQGTGNGIGGIVGNINADDASNCINNSWNKASVISNSGVAAGGIVGRAARFKIKNCKNTGNIIVAPTYGGQYSAAGGIVGLTYSANTPCYITNCGVECDKICEEAGTGRKYCGGIIGYGRNNVTVTNSYAIINSMYGSTHTSYTPKGSAAGIAGLMTVGSGNTANLITVNTYISFTILSGTMKYPTAYIQSNSSESNICTYVNYNYINNPGDDPPTGLNGYPNAYFDSDGKKKYGSIYHDTTNIGAALRGYREKELGDSCLTWTSDAIPTLDWTGIFPASK